jgi:hypothetical protein
MLHLYSQEFPNVIPSSLFAVSHGPFAPNATTGEIVRRNSGVCREGRTSVEPCALNTGLMDDAKSYTRLQIIEGRQKPNVTNHLLPKAA